MAKPQYMVAVPAVLEAGAETTFCASLLQPNETLVMTVTLISQEKNTSLLKRTSSEESHTSYQIDQNSPCYKETKQYNIIEIEDANSNRIGQWLNETSDAKILQLSYSLNSEASEGFYQLSYSLNSEASEGFYQVVDVYKRQVVHPLRGSAIALSAVLTSVNSPNMQCGEFLLLNNTRVFIYFHLIRYTYGQPVPGSVEVEVCRPLQRYTMSLSVITPDHPEGIPLVEVPCFKETKQTDKTGCAAFTIPMSTFTKMDKKAVQDHLRFRVKMEEEGTGISRPQETRIQISHVIGKLSFIHTPKIYNKGENVAGQVKAVHFNNTPIPDMKLYVFKGERWSASRLHNLTTDSNGFASFSLNTETFGGDIQLHVSNKPELGYSGYRTPYYEDGHHTVSLAQASTPDTKTVSTLEVKKKNEPLPCDKEEDISIRYTVVGEKQGSVHVMYLVLSRGAIVTQGFKQVEVQDQSVNEGEVSFKFTVSPDSAPDIQVLAYTILPSETVIAHSADFSTEKCFGHKVSLEFSPSSAVPGEETTMQVTSQPDSLCGVSAVDQSVLIKEPGKILNADKRTPYYEDGHHTVSLAQASTPDTKTVSTLEVKKKDEPLPCDKEEDISIRYTVVGEKQGSVHVMYLVLSRGAIVTQGFKQVEVQDQSVNEGEVSFKFTVSPDSAPDIQVLAYTILPSETVIAHSADFSTEKCFGHKVSLEFSPSSAVPGEETTMQVTSQPDSLCGVSAVDQSVLIKEPGKTLNADKIFGLLPVSKSTHIPYEVQDPVECMLVRPKRYVLPYPSERDDAYTVFENIGMKMATNLFIRTPSCLKYRGREYHHGHHGPHYGIGYRFNSVPVVARMDVALGSAGSAGGDYPEPPPLQTVRTFFPETWIWDLVEVGETGTKDVSLTVPDTITTWETEAFCLSPQGFGLAPRKEITVFQPFFLELTLPYSIIRGEHFELKATIFNYLSTCIMLTVTPTPSLDYTLTPLSGDEYTSCLCGNERKTLSWTMAPSVLGEERYGPLKVGSVRCSVLVSQCFYAGDILGRALKNLDGLLQMPYGCGEQNMALLAPNIYILQYLKNTKQLTPAILEKATNFLTSGYQRQLNYKISVHYNIPTPTDVTTLSVEVIPEAVCNNKSQRPKLNLKFKSLLGGLLHWSQTATDTSASLSVEISSYVMLAKLSASPTPEDLGYTSGIVRWLTGQQNHYGGFSSTQDTVVALQALALYSTLVFSPEGSSTVTVQSPSGQLTIDVNQNNKLLYQEKTLPDVTGKYSLEVKGTACASMQISVHYNIPTPTDVTTLSVEVIPEAVCNNKSQRPKLNLKFKSLYSGKETTTNMVILDIKMLSGFVPDPESLKRLQGALLVDRVEQKKDHVMVYIRELPKDTVINHSLELIQELPVQNLKPAVVKIYDYYQPSDQAETQYIYPCAAA
ncbi:alpha-2-macroglobulin-like [Seriola lalandi dorsalis]|uniref:alpha-2-macroglobulin-like n=1 Tax=Seriola lalandi dorsalis TaxID=1841481 RepID=UPI000C6F939E|nr:alpha-2-macroglobulin-like [Seriola lalandi dorsalis]